MGFTAWLYAASGLAVGLLVGAAVALRWRRRLAHITATERAGTVRTVADAAAARARAERSLRETQAHFQELLKGRRGFAVFTLDAGGHVATWSREAEEVYGYPESQVRGRPVSLFYPPPEAGGSAVEMNLLHARANGRADESGWRVRRDGARFRARVVTAARPGADGRVDGFWCLTERLDDESQKSAVSPPLARPPVGDKMRQDLPRPADERTLQSQKLEALGRLAGGVAHDFNNLLTVILGYADILKQYGADDHSREVGGEIQKAGERAAALTRQLLAFSRKQVLQPIVLDLNNLVQNLNTMLRRLINEDIDLTHALHPSAVWVKADPGQIEQVLTNLVVNARDAMPHGGRLLISTAEVPSSRPNALSAGGGGYAILTVKDTGQGMDERVLKRLFEPFFTTKEVGKGTGLGLATVHGIVHQSGGRIEVESEPGRGSTFRVYLPLTDAAPDAPPRAEPEIEAGDAKETILLVEDEDSLRQLARRTLQSQGYNILEACDGAAALVLCQRHLPFIDIVVTDVVMPNLSGVDLVQRLKLVRPKLKVLYMSGYTDSTVIRHGMEETEVNYLQKPFTPDVLRRKVRELLDQSHVRT
jgi:two-component system, cell cycle sensor histidine kinase and response regulator CckA